VIGNLNVNAMILLLDTSCHWNTINPMKALLNERSEYQLSEEIAPQDVSPWP
jgi:hypothetical protein